jgi:stress-induced morphogen
MNIQQQIESKLGEQLQPSFLEVVNESDQHNVPANSETHFKVVIASAQFEGQRPVARHQKIYRALSEELAGPVHALALHTYTASEWEDQQVAPESPACLGGSKKEAQ